MADRLSEDVARCREEGFGCHYGAFAAVRDGAPDPGRELRIQADQDRRARERRYEENRKAGPVIYSPIDDEDDPVELRIFARWLRGRPVAAIAQELGIKDYIIRAMQDMLGLPANNGRRPQGQWSMVRQDGQYRAVAAE